MTFDAIVVGSGVSGGWAAKELAEQGFRVLVLERGKKIEHGADYHDTLEPWAWNNFGQVAEDEARAAYPIQSKCYAFNSNNKDFWVRDDEHPYSTPDNRPFRWIRGYHLGGRSLMWGRQSYRWGDVNFEDNRKDGRGVDWPIRYADLAPWYDHVERFAGISGSMENIDAVPDGVFQPPMDMTAPEKYFAARVKENFPDRRVMIGRVANLTQPTDEQTALGRGTCQSRDLCFNGCQFGAYFSSLSATLPAAERTGNLTIVTDAIVESVLYDPQTRRATGVRVIDAQTRVGKTFEARVIFLCASTIPSTQILLNSTSETFPTGLANRSDQLGRNLMDHFGVLTIGVTDGRFDDRYFQGRRPNGCYIPRYQNIGGRDAHFLRGFGYQLGGVRPVSWKAGAVTPGIGAALKERLRKPGAWMVWIGGFGEMLPDPNNRITLHPARKDKWGMPIVHIDCDYGENERLMAKQMTIDAVEMLTSAGFQTQPVDQQPFTQLQPPGDKIHEMGTARMGRDPATSVLNGFNHAHDVDNLYVTDGAAMASSACQNPSLTYMALTARAARHAGERLKAGAL